MLYSASPTGAIPLPQLLSPRRARTSSADPAPQPLTGKAEPRAFSFSFVSKVTTTPSLGHRASGEGRHSLRHSHSLGDRSGLLTETKRGRSACRGPRLPSEGPRTHPEEMAKFKLPFRNVLEKPGVGGPAGGRGRTRGARPPRLQGKFLVARGAEPWAGAAQVQPAPAWGVGKKPQN